MDPIEFHQLALSLVDGGTPAEVRSAISRAYYAIFHVSANILRGMGFRIKRTAEGHTDVAHRLSNCGHTNVIYIGQNLGDLRGMRNDADYRLDKPQNQKTARAIIKQVGTWIEDLTLYCSGPDKAQIREAIDKWERMSGNLSNP